MKLKQIFQSSRNAEAGPAKARVASLAAFTMVEIAIALGIIGFALVAIIGILPAGMSVQKDNREETIINFDSAFLMNAIRTGAQGQDDLTNYVIAITNYYTLCSNGVPIGLTYSNWFTKTGFGITGNASAGFAVPGTTQTYSILTNGANIIGLLTIPKYIAAGGANYFSNYTTADFRALTGAAVDQGTNAASQDFAFKYRAFPEIIPSASFAYADPAWENFTAPGLATNAATSPYANNLQNNFAQIRLRFRWPVLPSGQVANGRQVFRGSACGAITPSNPTYSGVTVQQYFIQPGVL